MRLIDADALADALFEKRKNYPQWVADVIGNMPDAIVRCKDCIHFEPNNIPEEGCGYCILLDRTFYDDNYCGYGEKVKK